MLNRERPSGVNSLLVNYLERDKGYSFQGIVETSDKTHTLLQFEREGHLYAVKVSCGNSKGGSWAMLREMVNCQRLEDVSGIVTVYEGERLVLGGSYVGYVVKDWLPGEKLSEVDLTQDMADYMLNTMEEVHRRGLVYEPDLNSGDFVLNAEGLPILVDTENMCEFNGRNSFLRGDDYRNISYLLSGLMDEDLKIGNGVPVKDYLLDLVKLGAPILGIPGALFLGAGCLAGAVSYDDLNIFEQGLLVFAGLRSLELSGFMSLVSFMFLNSFNRSFLEERTFRKTPVSFRG